MDANTPAGWFQDPHQRHQHRYWDGNAWTAHVADNGVQGSDPVPPDPAPSAQWAPRVDLVAARRILHDLIQATNSQGRVANDQIDMLRHRWGVAADTPTTPEEMMQRFRPPFGPLLERPWWWVLATAKAAASAGEHDLVGYCIYWIFMWRDILEPKFGPYEKSFFLTSSVPSGVLSEMRPIAVASLAQLSPEHVLFGDETGQITAGWLAAAAPRMLATR